MRDPRAYLPSRPSPSRSTLLLLLILLSAITTPGRAGAAGAEEVTEPQRHMDEGLKAYQRGALEDAIAKWADAARLYESAGDKAQVSLALSRLGDAFQALGQYRRALTSLETALDLAREIGDGRQEALILGQIGNALIATGPLEKAQEFLADALQRARRLDDARLTAATLNNLGNLLLLQRRHDEASAAYTESIKLGAAAGHHELVVRALANAAVAAREGGRPAESKTLLDDALRVARALPRSRDKGHALVMIGLAYRDLGARPEAASGPLRLLAAQALREASALAEQLRDPRGASYAWGHLGRLYESEARYEEALELTRRATFRAQQAHAPESLYRWQWQTGRLLRHLGKREEALGAYRRAVRALQSTRPELPVRYGSLESSFRDTVGPLYFELADLLLQQAASTADARGTTPYLTEARETIETFKAEELRDYFRDDCVDLVRSKITKVEAAAYTAAIIYPILLADRVELLVSLPAGLKRVTVPVTAAQVTEEVRHFRRKLEKRTTREYLPHAQQLYAWLIRPLEPDLATVSIDTLVFVPDGALRTVPMAALHDGERFLIAKYALAITPGLDLTDPRPLKREQPRSLALGLTQAVQGFPALPHVSEEVEGIGRLYRGAALLDRDFNLARVEKTLREERFSIVHIASHGQFGSNADDTFLLTFDGKLTLDRLDRFLGVFRFRDEPLELLTLSACETAAGDDRAALGLAGIAIKAGARSAVATLWFINDRASSELIVDFYRHLQDPALSRAVALQRAQLRQLADPRYDHPGFWAPFLLINTWL